MSERIRGNAWKIKWNSWSKEAFEKAKRENKLVLLSLAGVWCHWCHVMDETTYSDEEIISLINENFIPIRVDVDERPDISERYNFGGFPTFAFLTHEGDVITGGTYVPPAQFKEIVKEMIELNKKGDIKDLIASSVSKKSEIRKANPNEKIIWDVVDILISYFDESYGGFGIEPKFPISDAILFLENMYSITKKNGFNVMVKKTLEGMLNGIYDEIEGGFFRYSVTRDWKNPHYEKMLETNANLLLCYAYYYYLSGERKYKDVVEKTANYLIKNLRDKDTGLFYSSQDADEVYYSLNLEERKKRNPPYIDKNIYSCKNSLCAISFLKSGILLNNEDYINIALEVSKKLYNEYLTKEGILHSKNLNISYLDDNVLFLDLLLNLYSYYLDEEYLERAKNIADIIVKEYIDSNGLLKDRKPSEDSLGLLKEPYHPLNENSLAAKDLYILGELISDENLKKISQEITSILSANYASYSLFASSFANSLLFLLNPIEIRLVFSNKDVAKNIIKENKLILDPLVYIKYIDFNSEDSKREYNKEGIYVCKGTLCYPPVYTSDELNKLMEKILKESLKF
ncbi:MAG: DUF255 domain-containing protein [Thermoproteota archaeon]|jgi:uncharacterized protein YyaL (SSP411 family)|nr:DUF255 domain-containing protein [Thermoproteota archaeon]